MNLPGIQQSKEMNNSITGKSVKKIPGIFIFLFLSVFSYATHQVGGYISYKWLGGYTYQITINDYTNSYPFATTADRDTMRIWFDDNNGGINSAVLSRLNGETGDQLFANGDPTPYGELLCNWVPGSPPTALNGARKYDLYQTTYTFSGPGNYHLWMDDQDRMANINNITGSVGVDYYMYTSLTIPPPDYFVNGQPFYINSPVITNPPVCQYGCTGECYTYNPGAYIPDLPPGADDSISYAMGNSLMLNPVNPLNPEIAQGYYNPGATVNDVTGTLTWCKPQEGLWNFVILMITYQRTYSTIGGITVKTIAPIDTTELELEVIINSTCNYNPAVTSKDTCIEAGGNVSITYTVTDPGQHFYVAGEGEPFSLSPAATLSESGGPFSSPLFTTLNWATNCNEVRENPYEVVIKATQKVPEGGTPPDTDFYSGYGTSLITVVGPPPQHLMATNEGTTVCLHWGPSPCPRDTIYNIYRQKSCSTWKHGYCETGVPAYTGFTLLATNYGLYDTTYCDSNGGAGLSAGVSYSYIVDGVYPLPDGSQSYASNDTCITIKLGVPLITNVSVNKTDPSNGKMYVRWIKPFPDPEDLDTIQYPPPYKYVLERAPGMNGNSFTPLVTYTSSVFNTKGIDTTFMDVGLDTQDSSYNYKVDFYNGPDSTYAGSSGTASSIYLRLHREDQSMNLTWSASVPWNNDTFYIYRQGPLPAYNFIAKTTGTTYTDTGLHNGSQYCYYVKSYSEYTGASRVGHPLYDSSETICGIPEDTIAPCSPPLNVAAKCVLYEDSIMWSNPNNLCPKANKVTGYQIWYTPIENGDMQIIATLDSNATLFVNSNLTSVAGCYAVLAIDSAGQTSPLNTVCVDNCPDYELPNVFTPNGDGINDLFTPLEPFRYVKDIDINIYNRWGQIVFHTTDPIINWNGNVDNSGGPCPDGIYYYICVVNEIRVQGIVPVKLKGFIQLIRN